MLCVKPPGSSTPPARFALLELAIVLAAPSFRVTFVVPAPVPPGPVIVVVPVYVLGPLNAIRPLLLALSVMFPEPLITPDSVRGELAMPLFRSTRLLAPSVQVPVLTTGVPASAAKLTPAPVTELV